MDFFADRRERAPSKLVTGGVSLYTSVMSTAPRYQPHYTVADYCQWAGDWELWNGTAVSMSPSPLGPHERAVAKLVFQIESCLQRHSCRCASYAGLDWIVQEDTVVRPDVMIVCGSQPGRYLEHPPAVAIEVLSPATADKDRSAKRSLYESAGVGHYLLIDPVAKTIDWLALDEAGRYHDRSAEIAEADRFSLTLDEGCRVEFDRHTTFA
jgi:Uma2 family endonuclease